MSKNDFDEFNSINNDIKKGETSVMFPQSPTIDDDKHTFLPLNITYDCQAFHSEEEMIVDNDYDSSSSIHNNQYPLCPENCDISIANDC